MKTTKSIAALSKILIAILLLGSALSSCKKDEVKQNTETGNIANALSQFKSTPQSFTLSAINGGTVTGAEGLTLTFPANAFVTLGGAAVTGSVSISLTEINTKGKMVLNNAPTTSQGKFLKSGGEFLIEAEQGGSKLKLAPGKRVFAYKAVNNGDGAMGFFTGKTEADGSLDWTEEGQGQQVAVKDTFNGSNGVSGYAYNLDSLGWSNFDRFYGNANNTTFKVQTPVEYVDSNTAVYVVFENENTAARLGFFDDAAHTFEVDHSNTIPIGTQIRVVAIAERNGQMYWSSTATTVTANQVLPITFTAKTRQEIDQLANAL
jgi:hypothetical protein